MRELKRTAQKGRMQSKMIQVCKFFRTDSVMISTQEMRQSRIQKYDIDAVTKMINQDRSRLKWRN